jgi:hypothetical protein
MFCIEIISKEKRFGEVNFNFEARKKIFGGSSEMFGNSRRYKKTSISWENLEH